MAGCGDAGRAADPSPIPQALPSPNTAPTQAALVPIDGGLTAGGGSYKGLPLGLTNTGEPTVTPVDGVIGLVCIGMSNSNQECADYIEQVDAGRMAGTINPAVRLVNCAVGGHAIERWIDPAYDRDLWGTLPRWWWLRGTFLAHGPVPGQAPWHLCPVGC
jgi:hypothetical protein